MWTFVVPNLMTALSYFLIPIALGLLMRLNPHLPHQWLGMLFIAFILACGGTHASHVLVNQHPAPQTMAEWATVTVDWVCAITSFATAFVMFIYLPKFQGFLIMCGKPDA